MDSTSAQPPNPPGHQNADSTEIKINPSRRALSRIADLPRPTTPLRRASSAGPPSTHHSGITSGRRYRTPSGQARTPAAARNGGSIRRTVAVTPHGRAAQRELDLRRAGLTPGKDRRRSGRQQRETPRDVLRLLSRRLAPKSELVIPTPQKQDTKARRSLVPDGEDELDDTVPERPRLSLPMGDEDDDDDTLLLPPRSAGLEDDNFTLQSIELGRRAISEQPPGRFSRGSFGSVRMSDVFSDLDDQGGGGGQGYEFSYLGGDAFGDDVPERLDDSMLPDDNTENLRGLATQTGRDSDIHPGAILGDDTETTFVLNVPPREYFQDQVDDEASRISETQANDAAIDSEPEEVEPEEFEGMVEQEEADVDMDMDLDLETPDDPQETSKMTEAMDNNSSIQDKTLQDVDLTTLNKAKVGKKRTVKVSKHGIQYPSLPAGVVKKLATTFARTAGNSKAKINKETLDAIMQASDWFFEQISDDLGAYAGHAGRKTIDESDVVTLMARQRQTNATTTPFSLAQKYLPRELLQDLRMVPPSKLKRGRQLDLVEEEEEWGTDA